MTESLPRSVLIMAGGTGGHVFPALAAAEKLRAKGINVEWLGTDRGIESRLVPAANIPIHFIKVSGLRGKGIVSIAKALFQLFGSVLAALRVVKRIKPVCVLGMGGFVSGPGGVAAWLTNRPLVIHEQNAVAGTTNKLLAGLASKVLLGYPITLGGDKSKHIGNPVRGEIAQIPTPEQRGIGRSSHLRLLVLGGSLGAKPINELLPEALYKLNEIQRPEVWHQTGKDHQQRVSDAYQHHNIDAKTEAFIDDMAQAYAWADVVLCRAGALTVAELAAAGVASILVPLPHAIDDHQTENARWLVSNNAGILVEQCALDAESLAKLLINFDENRSELLVMAVAARCLAKVDAAEQAATICLEVANG
jgi:UDP-N-acetylglucosamine--N-acetylmuramyl-(pentapeptide) pyrophosphoryl-undecaprenol N-acetylglucosamine transferase